MVKNTGIPDNQLSDLDLGQVLKDAHSKRQHALDVNVVNSGVASKYSEIVPEYDSSGRLITLSYYGLGLPSIFSLEISKDPFGVGEITSFVFTGQTPASLSGRYVTLNDLAGKVVVWFDVDNASTQPTVSGANRYIEVDISSSDSALAITNKTSSTINSDSEFSSQTSGSIAVVQNLDIGNMTNATIGDTTLLIGIQNGKDSLAGKFFYLWKYDNTSKYTFYYKIDGIGSEPVHSGESLTAIEILSTDDPTSIATKTAAVISLNKYFSSISKDSSFIVNYRPSGFNSGFQDGNTGFIISNIQTGTNQELVQEVVLSYSPEGKFINYKKLIQE